MSEESQQQPYSVGPVTFPPFISFNIEQVRMERRQINIKAAAAQG